MDQATTYALLAAGAYWDIRTLSTNRAPIPPGWKVLDEFTVSSSGSNATALGSAFSARVYQGPGGQIVISYAGTEFPEGITSGLTNDFVSGNLPLATGSYGKQAYDAALLYQKVQAKYGAGADVSFTGHSLGGGLAGLMAAWFDRPAVVFDPAPFELSAREIGPPLVMTPAYLVVQAALAVQGYHDPKFDNYHPLIDYAGRESHVVSYAVQGEILELLDYLLLPRIEASRTPKLVGAAPDLSGGDKHSIDLLAAVLLNSSFEQACKDFPTLLPLLFDHGLYGPIALGARQNLLAKLLREEVGVYDELTGQLISPATALLTKFTADVNRIGTGGGTTSAADIKKGLLVAAMEYYYFNAASSATALFSLNGGAINFNYADIAQSQGELKSTKVLADAVVALAADAASFAAGAARSANAWHIQSGSDAMTWVATGSTDDAAIGGTAADNLDGGAGDDLLLGLGGSDTLLGGAGSDVLAGGDGSDSLDGGEGPDYLYGGTGNDTYNFDGNFGGDWIIDADGQGSIVANGVTLAGGKKKADGFYVDEATGWSYTVAGDDLILRKDGSLNQIRVRNWQPGQLGITLDETQAQPQTTNTLTGDFKKKTNPDGSQYLFDSDGNYVSDGVQAGAQDLITGTAGDDSIKGLGGDDALLGRAGNDYIEGGTGNDVLEGGLGADTLIGGDGIDVIYGSSTGSLYYPTRTDYTPPAPSYPVVLGQGFDWAHSSPGPDFDGFQQGFLSSNVGRDEQYGDAGNTIDAGAGDDYVFAGTGNDIVSGGAGRDDIYGMGGSDVLNGDDGDDRIYGDGPSQYDPSLIVYAAPQDHGADVIDGGAGNDLLIGQGQGDDLYGGTGDDSLYGDDRDSMNTTPDVNGNDYLDGGDGNDKLIGGGRDDQLFGGGGDDSLWGDSGSVSPSDGAYLPPSYHGDDYLDGEDGNDYLQGEGGADTLFGGDGSDTLNGDGPESVLPGSAQGDDYLDGEAGNDTLGGGGGNDTLFGGTGNDFLDGDDVDASLSGAFQGNDYLDGEDGDDLLIARGGNDTLYGGKGDDELQGDANTAAVAGTFHGSDYLDGEEGNDTLFGEGGDDQLVGGEGNDYLDGDGTLGDVAGEFHGDDQLDGGAGNDTLIGGGGNDQLDAGDGDDVLTGDILGNVDASLQGSDTLDGGAGNDTLFGDGGDDQLSGGSGDDWLAGENETSSADISMLSGNDQLDGGSGRDTLVGGNGNDWLSGGADDDRLYGGAGDDLLLGGSGNDFLRPGDGDDTMMGGDGDDVYYFALGSGIKHIEDGSGYDLLVLEGGILLGMLFLRLGSLFIGTGADGGGIHLDGVDYDNLAGTSPIDAIQFSDGSTMTIAQVLDALPIEIPATEQADTLRGTSGKEIIHALAGDDVVDGRGGNDLLDLGAGNDLAYGGDGDDTLTGGDGNDAMQGDAGADQLDGGAGNDSLAGGDSGDWLSAGDGNDVLDGGAGNDTLLAGQGADVLAAGAGNDTLDGGSGADTMSGGAGDDTFIVDDANDQVIEAADEGHDTVYSALSLTLSNNVEDLVLQAGSAALSAGGNALDNALTGNDNDNLLSGLAGADTLIGAAGNDTLDGGSGSDAMSGGQGNDLYLVDAATDAVTELNAEGDDTVVASVDFTLGDNVETLMLTGTAVAGTGNALANTINGNAQDNLLDGQGGDDLLQGGAGNDLLVGGSGVDLLVGGTGDDLYDVDRSDDQVVEQSGEGNDTVQSSVSYVLGANLENLVLTGFSSVDATGNELANQLTGNGGSNLLDGGAGIDTMAGGDGDDTYVLDSAADQVIELADEGSDTVVVGFSYATGNNIENVRLSGSANLDATGDAGDNVLEGNAGNNLLTGGGGSDLLIGGDGDDTYIVDSEDDGVVEAAGEGTDTVVRSYDSFFILNDGVENLTLTGTVERGNGNDLDNLIIGNASDNNLLGLDGDDTLIGGAGNDALFGSEGADSLVGGSGDDYYEVDDAGDILVEGTGEGDDFIRSSVSWTLGANFERVALTGSDNLNVTGNALANGLWGNTGNNTLTGGQGNDFLFGDAGNDVYVYNRGDGQDSVDNTDALGATDTLRFGATITDNDVLAFQSGANLFFKVKGSSDQVGFINYYAGNSVVNGVTQDHKIDRIEFSNGVVWDQAMIQTVVDRANNNHSPTVNTFLPTLSAKAGSVFSYAVPLNTITDPDVWDSVTYRISMQDGSAVPAWLSFDPVTRTMSGTPGTGNVGSLQFVLWGTDNYNFSAGEFVTLNVGPANRAPVVNAALADKTAAQGAPLSFALPASSFTDADADALAYTATLADGSALPGWLSFNAGTRTFSGTPPTIGTVSVKVTATDTSNASASDVFDIAVSLQNLVLTGTANADTLAGGTGNDSLNGAGGNDTLIGNAGNDTLNGGTGNDSMTGGTGDDTYVIDSTTDVIVEALNEGIDTVQSTLTTYTLGSNVENLLLGGTTGLSGIGNDLANLLTGNSGNNALTGGLGNDTLDGGTGNDTLTGGAGDDVYVVNVNTDVVTENASEGIDTINSALTWSISATTNIENITLTGSGAFNATGNLNANVLIGNSGANVLTGAEGNDTYSGGLGNDTLTDTSTTSNDVYRWGSGDGLDTLSDAGGSDRIEIGAGITASQVTLTRSGNNLVIGLTTGTDKLTVSNWYVGTTNKIEEIRLANGSVIPSSSVPLSFTGTQAGQGISIDQDAAALVTAMAQFSVPGDSDGGHQHPLASSMKPVPMLAMPGSIL
ncbi:Ca2+-binding protein, RTX toxin-related [Rhizobacter sp. OV335]|nr:Ca2+-binding protein, RTX toxin-related [Rhizobacter sp. OV335]